jgi:N-hydroxyarylamine O-acetyltransferase
MTTDATPTLDLDAYLARTGYAGPLTPWRATLEGLHLAHATHIPFENVDVLLGRPIRLDLDGLQAKLVRRKRGGYCFEQNALLAAVLEHVGFRVTRLAARVRYGATRLLPKTHMLLKVEAEGAEFVADVGFGADGLLLPLPLAPGAVTEQFAWSYRLWPEGDLLALQSMYHGEWRDLYVFTMEPQYDVDFEMANYFVSTHPNSRFTRMLTLQLPTPEVRHVLRGRRLSVNNGQTEEIRAVGEDELPALLADPFGIELEPGTRVRFPPEDPPPP